MQRFTESRLFLCFGFSGGIIKAVKALSQHFQTAGCGIFSVGAPPKAVCCGKKHLIILTDIHQDLPADVALLDALRKGNPFANGQVILILFAPVSTGSPADLQFHSITSKVCFKSSRAGSFKTADVLSVPLRVITAT